MQHKKITIVGGGPIGLSSAISLAKCGQEVVVLDNLAPVNNNGRVLALSYSSYYLLQELGVWPQVTTTEIKQVHISHDGFGVSNILAQDVNLASLGFTVKYSDLVHKLLEIVTQYPQIQLVKANVTEVVPGKNFALINYISEMQENCLTTDLAIIAEGGRINIPGVNYNVFDYKQTALIAELKVARYYSNTAFERFNQGGPFVLLPYQGNYILVWALNYDVADSILRNNTLVNSLQNFGFMKRFGEFTIINQARSFPLTLKIATKKVFAHIALIGNAAQTVHPISAQGLNLGLRDVETLTRQIIQGNNLSQYDKLRAADARFVITFTHILAKFLDNRHNMLNPLISSSLIALSNLKPLQNRLAQSLIFGSG